MPQLIDVLAPPFDQCPEFTVNHAVGSVALTYGEGVNCYVQDALNHKIFTKGDSFILLSAGIWLPLSFEFYRGPWGEGLGGTNELPDLRIQPVGKDSSYPYLYNAAGDGQKNIMFENFENVFNMFFDLNNYDIFIGGQSLLKEDFYVRLQILSMVNISMISVPASLDGKIFPAVPFIKIAHNNPLKAEPEA